MVNKLTEAELKDLHRKSSDHRKTLEAMERAACFYCLRRFPAKDIKKWVGRKERALCPHCEIDSVLPDDGTITDAMLSEMEHYWFHT